MSVAYRFRAYATPSRAGGMIAGCMPGLWLGTLVLTTADEDAIELVAGLILMVAAVLLWRAVTAPPPRPLPGAPVAAGFAGGFLGAATSLNGVAPVLLLARDKAAPQAFQADLALYFVAANAIGLLFLTLQGAIDEEALFPTASAVAAGLAGGQLGGHRARAAAAGGRVPPARARGRVPRRRGDGAHGVRRRTAVELAAPRLLAAHAVAQMDHAVGEPALLEQLQLDADAIGQRRRTAPDDDRRSRSRHSSTSPARSAWPASSGPPTLRSRSAAVFSARTASGSNSRSIRVRAVDTDESVREYTTLSALRQIPAKSSMTGLWSGNASGVSHGESTSYMRRPSR